MLWFALSVLAKTSQRFLRRHVSNWRPLLDAAGVAHRLVTMPGAGHGDFGEAGWGRAYQAVFDFLRDQVGIDVDPGARWIPRGDGPNLGRPLPPRPPTT